MVVPQEQSIRVAFSGADAEEERSVEVALAETKPLIEVLAGDMELGAGGVVDPEALAGADDVVGISVGECGGVSLHNLI